MTIDLPPLDPELEAIVATQRGARRAPDGSRARVQARLEASLATMSPAPTPSTAGIGRVLPALGTLVLGVAIGAVWSPRSSPVPSARVPTVRVEPSAAPPPTSAPVDPPVRVEALPTVAVKPVEARPPSIDTLAEERTLLEAARTSLLRRDATSALAMLDQHAAKHPKGRLVEEREAMRVQALAMAGRTDEARARAETFQRAYPDSLLLPSVKAAVRGTP